MGNYLVSMPLPRVVNYYGTVVMRLATLGSGCGSVGRAVAPDFRGPWFESSHWKIFLERLL